MEYARSDTARKKLYIEYRSRGGMDNELLLRQIFALRAEVTEIEGIGPIIASSLEHVLRTPSARRVIEFLKQRGVDPIEPEAAPVGEGGALAGKTFVITGTLSAPRGTIKKRIEEAGGKFTGSVSGSTDYLVAGENTGKTKLTAAADKHGVTILDEAGLEALLTGG